MSNEVFEKLRKAPRLDRFVRETNALYPMISGRLASYVAKLAEFGDSYFSSAETIMDLVWRISEEHGWSRDEIYDFYADFVIDFLREQELFLQTGKYSNAEKGGAQVIQEVYLDDEYMRSYMMGLLVSYAIFPHHFEQFRFFRDVFEPMIASDGACIEFGVGHGLFMSILISSGRNRRGYGYDLSDAALDIARSMMRVRGVDVERVELVNRNVVTMELPDETFAAMTAAGLLEHIENPAEFLRRVRNQLAPETGRFFVMLPINTAHTDHLILFDKVEDCQALMSEGGFQMVAERIMPTENLNDDELARKKVPIAYLGIFKVLAS